MKIVKNRARMLTIYIIITCVLVVAFSAVVNLYNRPHLVAQRELEKIARDYYENYFYEQFVNESGEELADYAESGFAPVKLRQLLLFDNGRHADSRRLFEKSNYLCDTNESTVKFYPKEPYGKTDYEMKSKLKCEVK